MSSRLSVFCISFMMIFAFLFCGPVWAVWVYQYPKTLEANQWPKKQKKLGDSTGILKLLGECQDTCNKIDGNKIRFGTYYRGNAKSDPENWKTFSEKTFMDYYKVAFVPCINKLDDLEDLAKKVSKEWAGNKKISKDAVKHVEDIAVEANKLSDDLKLAPKTVLAEEKQLVDENIQRQRELSAKAFGHVR